MIRLGIIGFGKIARDAHVPALQAVGGYGLKAVVTRSGCDQQGARCFDTADAMLQAIGKELDAVTISTPPGPRYAIARQCLAAGLDCLLEKPPATTLGEIENLRDEAARLGRVLFTTWHSQHAAAVDQARALLVGERIKRLAIRWHEDVNKYHPGQDWVWQAEGFGVFDPGINALSIASRIMPGKLIIDDATLRIPANREQPIKVQLALSSPVAEAPLSAVFDWCPAAEDEWTITVESAEGRILELRRGGAELLVDGVPQPAQGPGEYPSIYAEFAHLVEERRSRVDIEPLRLVADAMMVGKRETAPPFEWRNDGG
ncbi:Gfo/Idh/MocA family oxidoreductase [Sphingomonas sp. ID1715]|uniref:Gfo/Idh/MocA family protein n=1 Tax=Sphingomonas sp. ID1715 TaxID=1656898 RepID=UPI00148846C8|nr:Gfo/Idh/MocA family oxidoreductase [Sphingomonas sp. ID1715]NNM75885.1 Gfo/Idh/MocA family oxidoreductase [Sphingomonas sp. ID1715]